MAISYTITLKGNPENPDAKKKFYANATSSGEIKRKIINS